MVGSLRQKSREQVPVRGEMTWKVLENIYKHYREFEELYHQSGIEEIKLDNGYVVNFLDLRQGLKDLPKRQREAIYWMCIMNRREIDAAVLMGFATNPDGTAKWSSMVGEAKRNGLMKIIRDYWPPEEGFNNGCTG